MTSNRSEATLRGGTGGSYTAPASSGQQRLWIIDRLQTSGTPTYNSPMGQRFKGRLDADVLERCLAEIIRRHDVLRTTFKEQEGNVVQCIAGKGAPLTERVDLTDLPESRRLDRARALIRNRANTPFDLQTGPLLRTSLFRLQPDDHIFLFVIHHIISDGWSKMVLRRELRTLYSGFVAGRPSPLPELPMQYADYAVWQRKHLASEEMAGHLDFWRRQLEGAPMALDLPTDRPRPARQTFRGSVHEFDVPADMLSALRALSREGNVTLFMTLLAVFNVLLYRYSGQTDFLVGTPIANRSRTRFEFLIGVFINLLVLRGDLSGDPDFRELLARTRQMTLAAYTHQEAPFEKLVDLARQQGDLSRNPLFQVMFVLQNTPDPRQEMEAVEIEDLYLSTDTSKFDLSLEFREKGDHLHARLLYNTDLFDAGTIERMVGHFKHLVSGILANPEARISRLPLLTPAEERELHDWNRTEADYPKHLCLHELFEARVEHTPDAVAVVFEDTRVTYSELNRRANHLAAHLGKLGVEPDARVALCIERSIDMVVGALAILKAGGAYVPLEPDHPTERLSWILDDLRPAAVLTQHACLAVFEGHPNVVSIDDDTASDERASDVNPRSGVGPDNLAYVIYTSGSTGYPKGAANRHSSVVNCLCWYQAAYPLDARDRVLQKTVLSFDTSVLEIFIPLMVGARVVLARPGGQRESDYIIDLITSQRITSMQGVPSFYSMLVSDRRFGECRSLKTVFCGGEAIDMELVRRMKALLGIDLICAYGPTETAIAVSCWLGRVDEENAIAPIGRPVFNTKLYVLDEHGQPLPVGLSGELYVVGDGVGPGYVNHPELTAERFVEIEVLGECQTAYRTGDRVRRRADGELEFLGRMDTQVKVRGHRIELGEIEAVLKRHQGVDEAVVVLLGTPDNRRLAAYMTGARVDAEELRGHLKRSLPDYMIPASFHWLDRLPRFANGKLDRGALAERRSQAPAPDAEAAPATSVEESLAALWEPLLQTAGIGRHSNFFDLGGHSLLALRLVERINDHFKVDLPLGIVFEQPVLSDMAERITAAGKVDDTSAVRRLGDDEPIPMSYAQQRLWFLDRLQGPSSLYSVPYTLRLSGAVNVEAMHRALRSVVARHDVLRMSFPQERQQPRVELQPAYDPLEIVFLDDDAEAQDAGETGLVQLREHARRPFDLERGPLLRVVLVKLSDEEYLLLLNMHHIITDGWSMTVLIREFSELYRAYLERERNPLPPLALQYQDYAAWQRKRTGEVKDEQLRYWREQLEGAPELLELPFSRPRPSQQSFQGARFEYELPGELSAQLQAFSRDRDCTLFMTLLSAFALLLNRCSGQDDLSIGTPVANRSLETENIIGFFVNTLVMRFRIGDGETFNELVGETRRLCLEGYAHQDLPFEQLVEALRPPRSLGHNPLFQVMFALEYDNGTGLSLPGVQCERVALGGASAKFDLVVGIEERGSDLACRWSYNRDLFDEAPVRDMAGYFQTLLEAVTAHCDEPISTLPRPDAIGPGNA